MNRNSKYVLGAVGAILGLLSVACSGDDDGNGGAAGAAGTGGSGACLEPLELDCAPTFQPTFQNFYDNQLSSCGAASTGPSCHGPDGGQGGLYLTDIDEAYEMLLSPPDAAPRVIPGDPECSLLMRRLESDDPAFGMPPGDKLRDAERCAIRQWIANGAER